MLRSQANNIMDLYFFNHKGAALSIQKVPNICIHEKIWIELYVAVYRIQVQIAVSKSDIWYHIIKILDPHIRSLDNPDHKHEKVLAIVNIYVKQERGSVCVCVSRNSKIWGLLIKVWFAYRGSKCLRMAALRGAVNDRQTDRHLLGEQTKPCFWAELDELTNFLSSTKTVSFCWWKPFVIGDWGGWAHIGNSHSNINYFATYDCCRVSSQMYEKCTLKKEKEEVYVIWGTQRVT